MHASEVQRRGNLGDLCVRHAQEDDLCRHDELAPPRSDNALPHTRSLQRAGDRTPRGGRDPQRSPFATPRREDSRVEAMGIRTSGATGGGPGGIPEIGSHQECEQRAGGSDSQQQLRPEPRQPHQTPRSPTQRSALRRCCRRLRPRRCPSHSLMKVEKSSAGSRVIPAAYWPRLN